MSRMLVLLVALMAAAGAGAQTRIDPGQLGPRPVQVAPPESAVFFPDW